VKDFAPSEMVNEKAQALRYNREPNFEYTNLEMCKIAFLKRREVA